MKKIVVLSLALIMVIGMIGVETYAYFTDTETSSGNSLAAGTLDLKTNNADGVSQTLYATSMSPGATVGPSTIPLRNNGTTNSATLDIGFSYVESDGSPNIGLNKTKDELAAVIEVTTLMYNGTDVLATPLIDTNSNGYIDVHDLTHATNVTKLTGLIGLNAGVTKNFVIAVRLRSDATNDFQSDGITITMTFTLKQQ